MTATARRALLVFSAACRLARAQTAAAELKFDVASVKPNRVAACRGRWDFATAHGTLTAENAPLLRVVSRAYHLTDDRVIGPAWMESLCYDIRAKASSKATDRDLMDMLQTLLKERFHLAARLEAEERPILALVVDKGGSKLRAYGDNAPSPPAVDPGKVLFMARHLPDLCERLGKVTGRPVIDKTGLNGDYLIVLSYALFESADGNPSDFASDIVSAVREQLGLKLEAMRGVVDVLKIATVDKLPAEN